MVSIGGTLGCTPSQHNNQQTFPVQPSRCRPREHVPERGARGVKRDARKQPGRGTGGGRSPIPPFPHKHEHVDPDMYRWIGVRDLEPGRGAGGGRSPIPPFPHRHEHVDPGHVEVDRGEGSGGRQPTVDPFDNPNLDIPSFSLGLTTASQSLPSGSGTSQTPPPPRLGLASFKAPHSTSFGFSGFHAPLPSGTAGSSTPHQPILQASSSDEKERADDMDSVQHYGFGHRVSKKTTRFTPSD
ncbi:hypothetical protein M9H77_12549 [Catharanthus roseus]|uniref:Uncharacterized protein n=1 Tax=Catharanthus roseus TaxID=4058 RepID=A0ACC0BHN0_CATRO|nr:hypothetical protein M9H77_12549 [Catharanthus roseus]